MERKVQWCYMWDGVFGCLLNLCFSCISYVWCIVFQQQIVIEVFFYVIELVMNCLVGRIRTQLFEQRVCFYFVMNVFFMLYYQFFQVDNWGIYGMCCNDVQCVRDLNCKFVCFFFLIRNVEQSKGSRCRLCFLLGFNSSQFGFLYVVYFVVGFIIQNNNRQNSSYIEVGSDSKGAFSEGEVMIFQYILCVDIEDEYCVSYIIRCYSVNEFYLSNWVKYQFGEVYYFYMYSFKVEIGCDWVLYLVVCNQNLQCGQV